MSKGLVKTNEFIFGRAICFTYTNKRVFNDSTASDLYVIKNIEMMKCKWSIKPGERAYHAINMTRLWVQVSAKNNTTMRDISVFLKDEVNKRYFFAFLPEDLLGLAVAVAVKREGSVI